MTSIKSNSFKGVVVSPIQVGMILHVWVGCMMCGVGVSDTVLTREEDVCHVKVTESNYRTDLVGKTELEQRPKSFVLESNQKLDIAS